jgi:hypothetical protein
MCKPKTDGRAALLAAKNGHGCDTKLADSDQWLEDFDYEGFNAELKVLGKKLEAEQGDEDVHHLNKMIMWANGLAAAGLLTMGFSVNLFSIFCISTFVFARWTMIAHVSLLSLPCCCCCCCCGTRPLFPATVSSPKMTTTTLPPTTTAYLPWRLRKLSPRTKRPMESVQVRVGDVSTAVFRLV